MTPVSVAAWLQTFFDSVLYRFNNWNPKLGRSADGPFQQVSHVAVWLLQLKVDYLSGSFPLDFH